MGCTGVQTLSILHHNWKESGRRNYGPLFILCSYWVPSLLTWSSHTCYTKGLGNLILIYPGQCMTEGQRYAYMHVLIGLVKRIASDWEYDVPWWQLEKVQLSFQRAFPSFFCNFASCHIPCPALELSPWHILPMSLPIKRWLLRAYLGRVNHDLGLYSILINTQISCLQFKK
jgi:hypothetical protein